MHQAGAPGRNPPDGDDEDSDDDRKDKPNRRHPPTPPRYRSQNDVDTKDDQGNKDERRKNLGMNGLMRSFVGKPTFGGNWDEDLDNCICVFETMAKMCEISEIEKVKSIPIMLKGDALNYYSGNIRGCSNFDDAMELMR